jgi:hypothetical protein
MACPNHRLPSDCTWVCQRVAHRDREILRNWFAGMAMTVLIPKDSEHIAHSIVAKDSYRMADAMLKARGNEGEAR